jgi:hypothetical protein
MTTQQEVLGYTTADLIDAMSASGIHCSLDRFRQLALEIQRRALAHTALDRMVKNAEDLGLYDAPACGCEACQPNTSLGMRMILCATCGNKRCPHATDHRHACTNSNEPGQPGSSYGIPLEEAK